MNKLLTLILLLFVTYTGFGQKVRFTDSSNTWKVRASGKDYLGSPFTASYHYYYDGDTVVKGNSYKRMASYSVLVSGNYATYPRADIYFIREDTISGNIWSRMGGTGSSFPDTSEKLIYSPNWVLGDTAIKRSGLSVLFITHIDSTQINGIWHRVFGLGYSPIPQSTDYYRIIEGVGSDVGPGYAFTGGLTLESNYRLLCFYNQGNKPALSPAVQSFSNTQPCNLAIEELGAEGSARLYPNPVTSASKIELRGVMDKGELRIYDGMGRMIAQKEIVQSSSVSMPTISCPGLYYYTLADLQNGTMISGKFVRE